MKYLYSLLLVHILTIPPEIGFVCSCDRSIKLSIPFFLLLYPQNTFLSIVITRNRTEIRRRTGKQYAHNSFNFHLRAHAHHKIKNDVTESYDITSPFSTKTVSNVNSQFLNINNN